jgi:hypothetical protein
MIELGAEDLRRVATLMERFTRWCEETDPDTGWFQPTELTVTWPGELHSDPLVAPARNQQDVTKFRITLDGEGDACLQVDGDVSQWVQDFDARRQG